MTRYSICCCQLLLKDIFQFGTEKNMFARARNTIIAYLCSKIEGIKQKSMYDICNSRLSPDASVAHASGIGQLQANPPVTGPRLSPRGPT